MTPALSVLVAAHNEEAFIGEALESVFAQGLPDIEIVVVDDGSSDGTAQIVEASAANAPEGMAVRLLSHETNRGLAHARNAALAEARGGYVVLLDGDDCFDPGAFVALRDRLARDRAARLVIPRYRWIAGDGSPLPTASPVFDRPMSAQAILADNPIHSDSGVMTRRADLEAIGGFDEGLTGYIGADAWLRFAFAHTPGTIVQESTAAVRYRRHEGQITADWRRMDRNWRRVDAKLARDHADSFAPLRRMASAHHRLFCAHLAHAARDYRNARGLLAKALRTQPGLWRSRADARRLALACIASLLPAPLHDRLQERFGDK